MEIGIRVFEKTFPNLCSGYARPKAFLGPLEVKPIQLFKHFFVRRLAGLHQDGSGADGHFATLIELPDRRPCAESDEREGQDHPDLHQW